MSEASTNARSVVVERELPHRPEKIWRALTQPHLMEEWLMKSDFEPRVGHRFTLRGNWGSASCEVLEIEVNRSLSYTWDAMGLESVVTFTLTPTAAGTRLRMEQAGFPMDHEQAWRGAHAGWNNFLNKLEVLLAKPG